MIEDELWNSEENLFRTFVGRRSDKYMAAYRAVTAGKVTETWNIIAVSLPVPWCFYHKMYLVGALYFFAQIAGVYYFYPDAFGMITVLTASGGTLVALSNFLYVNHAKVAIRRAKAMNLPPYETADYLARAGGTSRPGAILGIVMTISAILVFLTLK